MSIIPVLAAVLAIVATVLAFVYIVPEKKRPGLNRFFQFLHDVANFKFLIIEKILQALYILSTSYVVLTGFFMLFYVQEGYSGRYYSTPDRWYGGYGLLLMILGPIVVRIAYEFLMMLVLLIKNVIQINNKIKSDGTNGGDVFATPTKDTYAAPARVAPQPVAYAAPQPQPQPQQEDNNVQ